MRWNLLLGLVVGFLTSLALVPEEQSSQATPAEITNARNRGFNEGYESGARDTFRIVELRKLGEYYYDTVNQRNAFRWFCDGDAGVAPPEDPDSSDHEERPPRVTSLSLDPKSREQSGSRRPAG
jgi:hypothetical protein